MSSSTPKKYVCIGKGKKHSAKRLAQLYGISAEECIFFKDENRFKNNNHKRHKLYDTSLRDRYYILRFRKRGDYKGYIAHIKTKRLLEGKPI